MSDKSALPLLTLLNHFIFLSNYNCLTYLTYGLCRLTLLTCMSLPL